MCAHHLVDPVACTPASGWEKGQVENQVGLVRERFFTPRLRFKSRDEQNQTTRARPVSATPISSDAASATAKTRRSRGSKLDADQGANLNAD